MEIQWLDVKERNQKEEWMSKFAYGKTYAGFKVLERHQAVRLKMQSKVVG